LWSSTLICALCSKGAAAGGIMPHPFRVDHPPGTFESITDRQGFVQNPAGAVCRALETEWGPKNHESHCKSAFLVRNIGTL
jgi:hypothetical protein